MSEQQQSVKQTAQSSTVRSTSPTEGEHSQNSFSVDLIIIEAGLRLKVLPLRDAVLQGRKLRLSALERCKRQIALFNLCGNTQHRIVDIGLFADAVARRPDVAERLWRALRSSCR